MGSIPPLTQITVPSAEALQTVRCEGRICHKIKAAPCVCLYPFSLNFILSNFPIREEKSKNTSFKSRRYPEDPF